MRDIPLLGRLIDLPLRSNVHENSPPSTSERNALQADPAVLRRLRDLLSEGFRHVLTELPLRTPDADIEGLMPFNVGERAPHQNTSPSYSWACRKMVI